MKVNFKTKIVGDINAWSQETQQQIINAVNKSALNIQKGAKRRAPVDTGNLRARIAIEPANAKGYALKVGTKVFYGPYIEFGTGVFSEHPTIKGRQTPWMFPKAEASNKKDYNWPIFTNDETGEEFYMTRGAKPHPFLFPAFEEERPNFEKEIRRALK
jgi:HK97 gp10 family phage protein